MEVPTQYVLPMEIVVPFEVNSLPVNSKHFSSKDCFAQKHIPGGADQKLV